MTPAAAALDLVGRCRDAGLEVPVDASVSFARALVVLGPATVDDVYWAGRATICRRPEDRPVYDAAFASMVAGGTVARELLVAAPAEQVLDEGTGAGAGVEPGGDRRVVRFSELEVLRRADVGTLDDDERAEVHRLMRDLAVGRSLRRSRRRRPARRGAGPLDVRRTARRALRTGGEPVERVMTRRRSTPRRLVLLLDVSGSMEPYARTLLRLGHLAATGGPRVEVFGLGTRLTRLTRLLRDRDPDAALVAAASSLVDRGGGTRLGETLRTFNDEWGVAGAARGATVVILSDGWDRGDPSVLAEQMARLSRVAHRVVWVNPLQASDGYEPLAAGMAAALPYVDEFLPGHSLAAIEELIGVIAD